MSINYLKGGDIKVVELFAGVGGFRLGLEGWGNRKLKGFKTIWANQYEPTTNIQHACDTYFQQFGKNELVCKLIEQVKVDEIPDHDLLVGGFPCQDYSVARTLRDARGLEGKKGVLWWEIYRILKEKNEKQPDFLMLENVDRLLKSPANQRGRDFAVMLTTLNNLGYAVEWGVINAADYGMPQRRRRVYIMGYKKGTKIYKKILSLSKPLLWITKLGVIYKAFPVEEISDVKELILDKDPVLVSNNFNKTSSKVGPFENRGIVLNGKIYTIKTKPISNEPKITINDILQEESEVAKEFYITTGIDKWKYLKGSKNEPRTSRDGKHTFIYTEGSMVFPDKLDEPSRTIVTGEGGPTPSRFKHVIKTKSGKLRRLTPIELERLCMFPDNHTIGQSNTKRAFFMGNALVVGVIERLGKSLIQEIKAS